MYKSKFSTVTMLMLVACGTAMAQGTVKDEASDIAIEFFKGRTENTRTAGATPSVKMAYTANVETSGDAAFYVFNRTDMKDGGFVIVSASEGGSRILGYSDKTAFDYATAPEGVKSLLYMMANNMDTEVAETRAATDLPRTVSPLLSSKWDQLSPYNQMCPSNGSDNAVTGCGATCISQVAYYYKYPVTGTGSNSYTSATNKFSCSFDFASATFDYANMIDSYSGAGTTEQKNAVAELMYAAGVATNMDYKIYPRSSTCTLNNVAVGLTKYFSYDAGLSVCRKDYYTLAGWKEMLCREIGEGRPVIYQGIGPSLGHVFILDGYNAVRMFHINWGWGGAYDGYYNVGDLSVGNYGALNTYLWVIRGIKPTEAGSIQSSEMYAGDLAAIDVKTPLRRNLDISISGLVAQNYEDALMDVGYFIFNSEGDTLQTEKIATVYGRSEVGNAYGKFTPYKLTSGCYKLVPAGKQTEGNDWQAIRFLKGAEKCVNIDVRADSAYCYTAAKALSATEIKYTPSQVEGDSVYTISCTVNNSVYKDYSNGLRVEIYGTGENAEKKQTIASSSETIGKKATQSITFTSSTAFPSGEYYIFIVDAEGHTIGMDIQELKSPISTGIEETPAHHSSDAIYYDLSGRRVRKGTEKGILIKQEQNGKTGKHVPVLNY